MQARAADERAEQLAQELRRRRGNREEVRAQLERAAEAGVKLQLQQRALEWRQKYQVGQHYVPSGQTDSQQHHHHAKFGSGRALGCLRDHAQHCEAWLNKYTGALPKQSDVVLSGEESNKATHIGRRSWRCG